MSARAPSIAQDRGEGPEVQGVGGEEDRDDGEGDDPSDAGEDEGALSPPPIHERTDDEPEEEVGNDAEGTEGTEDADLCGCRLEEGEGSQPQDLAVPTGSVAHPHRLGVPGMSSSRGTRTAPASF